MKAENLKGCWTLTNRPIYALREFQQEKTVKGGESLFEEIMAENFPNLSKELDKPIKLKRF